MSTPLRVAFPLVLMLGAPAASALPPIPEDVRDIVAGFTELEESFREGEWDTAGEELERMSASYERAQAALRSAAPVEHRSSITEFPKTLEAVREQLAAQDPEGAEAAFRKMQGQVITYIGFFDYAEHPILEFLQEEFEDMVANPDLDDIAVEAEEMGETFEQLGPQLVERGTDAADIEEFERLLAGLAEAAEKADKAKAVELLSSLSELNERVMSGS